GNITYDTSNFGSVLGGNGTSTLKLIGETFRIDATTLSGSTGGFSVTGIGGFSTAQGQTLQLMPGQLQLAVGQNQYLFTLTTQGITFDPSLDNVLSGNGTNTLTVLS